MNKQVKDIVTMLLGFLCIGAIAACAIATIAPHTPANVALVKIAKPASATYRFHGPAALSDLKITPGVAETTDLATVCAYSNASNPRKVTEKMKAEVYAAYGIDKSKVYRKLFCANGAKCDENPKAPLYEIDHLISRELGGADAIANLVPQPYYAHPGAREKDVLENYLHREVCTGRKDLGEAQRDISHDWYAAYLAMQKDRQAKRALP